MKIRNDPITQFWIDLNTDILKWIHQGEQIITMGDWNSEASEVNTWKHKESPIQYAIYTGTQMIQ